MGAAEMDRWVDRCAVVLRSLGVAGSTTGPGDTPRPGAMGRPVDGLRPRVRPHRTTRNLRTPDGEPATAGELDTQGPQLCLAILDREQDRPVWQHGDGHRWYSTGDFVYENPDGLTYLSRDADRVSINGVMLPALAMEDALRTHCGVRDAAVIGVEHTNGELVACAAIAPQSDRIPTLQDLCDHLCRHGFASDFLPRRLAVLPDLPRTSLGKLDRRHIRHSANSIL
ncbi:AMP-binding enzyme [Streptomyces lavendofoliae]|uniref:AMP-binding enzyme n=1 Tax=Streptomyces lavendofoliae TaxID=67314 RepID=UPI00300EF16F